MANKQLIKMYVAVKLGISMTTSSFSLTAFSIIEDAMKMKRSAWKNGQVQNLYGRFFFLQLIFATHVSDKAVKKELLKTND